MKPGNRRLWRTVLILADIRAAYAAAGKSDR